MGYLSKYVTEEIFPRFGIKVQGGINSRTAQRWMRREGFRHMKHQKGMSMSVLTSLNTAKRRLYPRLDHISLESSNMRLETARKKLSRRQPTSAQLPSCSMMNQPSEPVMPRRSLGSWTRPQERGWSGHTSMIALTLLVRQGWG